MSPTGAIHDEKEYDRLELTRFDCLPRLMTVQIKTILFIYAQTRHVVCKLHKRQERLWFRENASFTRKNTASATKNKVSKDNLF